MDWADAIEAYADINGRRVIFEAYLKNLKDPKYSFWEVSFREHHKMGHTLTGNRGEFEVFASAKTFIKYIIETKDSPKIVFRAEDLDGEDYEKRGEFYQKLATKFRPSGYSLHVEKTLNTFSFILTPKTSEAPDVTVDDRRERDRRMIQYKGS